MFLNGQLKFRRFVDRYKRFLKLCPKNCQRCKCGCEQTMASSVDSPSEITRIHILNDKFQATLVVALSARELGTMSKNNLKRAWPTLRINLRSGVPIFFFAAGRTPDRRLIEDKLPASSIATYRYQKAAFMSFQCKTCPMKNA